MANILVIFSNDKFKDSAWRIKQQAKSINFFDKIYHYGMKDLPPYIIASPLMFYERGVGGMIWKPYIIYNTMKVSNKGDVIYYIDAGSSICQSEEWGVYAEKIKTCNGIFFQYRNDFDYGYSKVWENGSPRLKHWTKPSELDYFIKYTGNENAGEDASLWSGFMIFKNCEETMKLVKEWMYHYLFHPELVVPPYGKEEENLPDYYSAKRHDQISISFLVLHYRKALNLEVLYETSESQKSCAVKAQRFMEGKKSFFKTLKFKIKFLLKFRKLT